MAYWHRQQGRAQGFARRKVEIGDPFGLLADGPLTSVLLLHLDLIIAADEEAAVVAFLLGPPFKADDEVFEAFGGNEMGIAAREHQHTVFDLPALGSLVGGFPALEGFAVEERPEAVLLFLFRRTLSNC